MTVTLYQGDCLSVMAGMAAAIVQSRIAQIA